MAESTQDRIQRVISDLQSRIDQLTNEPDMDALNHIAMDKNTKLSRLPDFEELAHSRKLHPDILYQQAIKLRVDRNEVEEKLLIPLRRAIAALLQFQSTIINGRGLLPNDDRPITEIEEEALTELLAQLMLAAHNFIDYDADPTSRPDDTSTSDLIKSLRRL